VPIALFPLVDVLGLATAVLLAGASGLGATVYVTAVLGLLCADGQHRLRICLRVSDQFPRTVAATAMPLLAVLPWAGGTAGLRLGLYSAALLVTLRAGACAGMRSAHRRGHLLEPTLIVGTGATAVQIAQLLCTHPALGLAPRGFLDSRLPEQRAALPVLGVPADLAETVRRHGIQRVIVCFPALSDADVVPLLRACRPLPADVCLVPRMYELGAALPRGCLDELWGIPLIPLRRLGHSRPAQLAKAVFDVTLATVLLVALTPLLVALVALIRRRCGAGALFRQTRVSTGGRAVPVVKLRTMVPHPDSDVRWSVSPEYTTRSGRWLRATHLDELPQLLNVLCGQMSLVGPRPERPYFAARFDGEIARYADRHRMPAGMTGWAQVHGLHGDTSIADRIRFDNQYIEYWSLWLDVVILVRTLGTLRASGPFTPSAPSGGRE
jgi:exopolysaccharide biosynthesis polyprenyl glycosylphosphotransferase